MSPELRARITCDGTSSQRDACSQSCLAWCCTITWMQMVWSQRERQEVTQRSWWAIRTLSRCAAPLPRTHSPGRSTTWTSRLMVALPGRTTATARAAGRFRRLQTFRIMRRRPSLLRMPRRTTTLAITSAAGSTEVTVRLMCDSSTHAATPQRTQIWQSASSATCHRPVQRWCQPTSAPPSSTC